MKKTFVWSCLVALSVLLSSGAAFSGGFTATYQVTDYTKTTGELLAYPGGSTPLTSLYTATTTQFLKGPTNLPPQPCHGISNAWNAFANFDSKHGTKSEVAFQTLLELMGRFQCNAKILTSSPQSGSTILAISPAL